MERGTTKSSKLMWISKYYQNWFWICCIAFSRLGLHEVSTFRCELYLQRRLLRLSSPTLYKDQSFRQHFQVRKHQKQKHLLRKNKKKKLGTTTLPSQMLPAPVESEVSRPRDSEISCGLRFYSAAPCTNHHKSTWQMPLLDNAMFSSNSPVVSRDIAKRFHERESQHLHCCYATCMFLEINTSKEFDKYFLHFLAHLLHQAASVGRWKQHIAMWWWSLWEVKRQAFLSFSWPQKTLKSKETCLKSSTPGCHGISTWNHNSEFWGFIWSIQIIDLGRPTSPTFWVFPEVSRWQDAAPWKPITVHQGSHRATQLQRSKRDAVSK